MTASLPLSLPLCAFFLLCDRVGYQDNKGLPNAFILPARVGGASWPRREGGKGAGDTTRECFGQAPAEYANIKQMF